MPLMYFSSYDRNEITFDEPNRRRMMVNPKTFASVQNNEKRNARVFSDTHLLILFLSVGKSFQCGASYSRIL